MRINPKASPLFVLIIVICASPAHLAVGQGRSPLTSAVARSIKIEEPEWNYTPGHCTCPPLISPQESASLGIWERKDSKGEREQLMMEIYQIASTQQAVEWMKSYSDSADKKTVRKEKDQLGDESYLLDYSAEKIGSETKLIGGPIALWFRKDNFLVSINGNSPDTVARFAMYALRKLSSN